MTPAVFFLGLAALPIACGDPIAKQLSDDVREAMVMACHSPQSVAIDLDVPLNKLYEQLNGNAPFTYCWRILAAFPDVRLEFCEIQARRVNAVMVRAGELRDLVGGVRELVASVPKRMAKASLPDSGRKAQAV